MLRPHDDYERAFQSHEAAIQLLVKRHRAVCSCGFQSAPGDEYDVTERLARHLRHEGALPNPLAWLHRCGELDAVAGIREPAVLTDAYRSDVSRERRDRARAALFGPPFEDELLGRARVLLDWYRDHVEEMTELLPGVDPLIRALQDFVDPSAAYARLAAEVTDAVPDDTSDPLDEVGWFDATPPDRLEMLFALAGSELTRRAWEERPEAGLSAGDEARMRFAVAACIAGWFQGEAMDRFELDLALEVALQLVVDEIAGLVRDPQRWPLAVHVWERLERIDADAPELFDLARAGLQNCEGWPAHPTWEAAVASFLERVQVPVDQWVVEADFRRSARGGSVTPPAGRADLVPGARPAVRATGLSPRAAKCYIGRAMTAPSLARRTFAFTPPGG